MKRPKPKASILRASTINRDLIWLNEFEAAFPLKKRGDVVAFAKQKGVTRETMSKALRRARATLEQRNQAPGP